MTGKQTIAQPSFPRTLFDLAGAERPVPNWQQSALILIDFQMEYVCGGLPLGQVGDDAIACTARLLDRARQEQTPVAHIVHHGRPGSPLFNPATPLVEIAPSLAPREDEKVIAKTRPDSFSGTDLQGWLQDQGRDSLIMAGFMTHMCVSSTARAALEPGYRVFIAEDCCASRDLALGAEVISAANVHRSALAALADRFAWIVSSADLRPD